MTKRRNLCCSFCYRSEHDVDKLVAGPGVYICDECIALCNRAIEGKRLPSFPPLAELSERELLERLPPASFAAGVADASLRAQVAALREKGVTWERIGESLGTTRQAAWARFAQTR